MTEEIKNYLEELKSKIDYEVGDWVETCNFLPGIVQKIDCYWDEEKEFINENVEIFYPHYALDTPGKYTGGSCCSIDGCGVHKITPEYAIKLFTIGQERLKQLWEEGDRDKEWSDLVEEEWRSICQK